MSGAGGERVRNLFDRAANAESLSAIIFQGIGAVLLAVGTAIASGVLTIADLILIPAQALANAAGLNIEVTFQGLARLINVGSITSAVSIAPGSRFDLGPLTLPLAMGIALLTLYIVIAYLSEEETGNFAPSLPFDIPTPGFIGPEEDDEES
ncbi:hypothetical protein BRC92_00325 [Halobacteriales archaeon QS_4_69_31]|nr:MAG: hypothetical protein BRC92_00325 [Halobacteriales archaeon QS_4_69_31]